MHEREHLRCDDAPASSLKVDEPEYVCGTCPADCACRHSGDGLEKIEASNESDSQLEVSRYVQVTAQLLLEGG